MYNVEVSLCGFKKSYITVITTPKAGRASCKVDARHKVESHDNEITSSFGCSINIAKISTFFRRKIDAAGKNEYTIIAISYTELSTDRQATNASIQHDSTDRQASSADSC
jgi:hypothetical protein